MLAPQCLLMMFKTITEETQIFENVFNDKLPLLKQIKTWHEKLDDTIYKPFKKIRVNKQDKKKLQSKSIQLQEKRSNLMKLVKKKINTIITQIIQ